LSSGMVAMRSPVNAAAEPANSTQTIEARRIVFMEFSLIFARSNAGLLAGNCCIPADFSKAKLGRVISDQAFHPSVGPLKLPGNTSVKPPLDEKIT
jgi:hypothetical protein